MQMNIVTEAQPLRHVFEITGYSFPMFHAVVVRLEDGEFTGVGEAQGVYYHGESSETIVQQLEGVRETIELGVTHTALLNLLPPGGARNAVDCALWDLEAKRSGKPVWVLAGLDSPPHPLRTVFTIGISDPETIARLATRDYATATAIKLKLGNDGSNEARVKAVRRARPDVWLMVDANQGLTPEAWNAILPIFREANVSLVEQPFPVGKEEWMDGIDRLIPVAADESVQTHADLPGIVGRFDVVNVKLDKCGGLTAAFTLAREATSHGLRLMVGNMTGSSLAMAPGYIIGQSCDVVDLDGPRLLTTDRTPSVVYQDGNISCSENVWGGANRS